MEVVYCSLTIDPLYLFNFVTYSSTVVDFTFMLNQGPLITDGRNRRTLISWAWILCRLDFKNLEFQKY